MIFLVLFQDMQQTYSVIYFWLEVVLQFFIGIAGFIANLAVAPILCRSGFVQGYITRTPFVQNRVSSWVAFDFSQPHRFLW